MENTYLVSNQTRSEVWTQIRDTEYAARYYEARADQFLRRHRLSTCAAILLGGGAVTPAIFALANVKIPLALAVIVAVLGLALAVISVLNLVENNAAKAVTSMDVAKACGSAKIEFLNLLNQIDKNQTEEDRVREELTRWKTVVQNETYQTVLAGIEVSNKDGYSRKALEETEKQMKYLQEQIYATT